MELETYTTIRIVENGATDTLQLDHYPHYAPGYRISVMTDPVRRKRFLTEYWLHDLTQAIVLFDALCDVAVSGTKAINE